MRARVRGTYRVFTEEQTNESIFKRTTTVAQVCPSHGHHTGAGCACHDGAGRPSRAKREWERLRQEQRLSLWHQPTEQPRVRNRAVGGPAVFRRAGWRYTEPDRRHELA